MWRLLLWLSWGIRKVKLEPVKLHDNLSREQPLVAGIGPSNVCVSEILLSELILQLVVKKPQMQNKNLIIRTKPADYSEIFPETFLEALRGSQGSIKGSPTLPYVSPCLQVRRIPWSSLY